MGVATIKSTEDFVRRAVEVHGDKYDYSESEYVNPGAKIKIICSKHGPFFQKWHNHISRRQGCIACRGRLTTEEYVSQARAVHGDKYDYSKTEYKSTKEHLVITCPDHGDFRQAAWLHTILKRGCPQCGVIKATEGQMWTINKFIKKARKVHGDKYDYSKVEYRGYEHPITILCPKHGPFVQTPHNHLAGGCYHCGRELCAGHNRLTTRDFIRKAREVHGDKYDYSKTKYTVSKDSVRINCPRHGIFKQNAANHMNGQGCPKCACAAGRSKGEIELFEAIQSICPDFEVLYSNRTVITPYEIDIYIPELNFAIEYNGEYWHNQKPDGYHEMKVNMCGERGIKLVHIWESKWQKDPETVLNNVIQELNSFASIT